MLNYSFLGHYPLLFVNQYKRTKGANGAAISPSATSCRLAAAHQLNGRDGYSSSGIRNVTSRVPSTPLRLFSFFYFFLLFLSSLSFFQSTVQFEREPYELCTIVKSFETKKKKISHVIFHNTKVVSVHRKDYLFYKAMETKAKKKVNEQNIKARQEG